MFPPLPHPPPRKQRANAEICMYLLEASLSTPGSRVVPERVRALAWERTHPTCVLRWYVAWTRPIRPIRPIRPQTRISSLVVDRRTDRSIDRSCAVDGALARVTNESRHATFRPRRSPSRAELVAPRACRSHHACDPSPPPRERQGPLRPRFGRCSRSGATWPSPVALFVTTTEC